MVFSGWLMQVAVSGSVLPHPAAHSVNAQEDGSGLVAGAEDVAHAYSCRAAHVDHFAF